MCSTARTLPTFKGKRKIGTNNIRTVAILILILICRRKTTSYNKYSEVPAQIVYTRKTPKHCIEQDDTSRCRALTALHIQLRMLENSLFPFCVPPLSLPAEAVHTGGRAVKKPVNMLISPVPILAMGPVYQTCDIRVR